MANADLLNAPVLPGLAYASSLLRKSRFFKSPRLPVAGLRVMSES